MKEFFRRTFQKVSASTKQENSAVQHKTFSDHECVRIRAGFIDEETGCDLSGWQGVVKESYPDEGTKLVEFDGITIRSMPDAYIEMSEDEGADWTSYTFGIEDLEPAQCRETVSNRKVAVAERASHHRYSHLGEEGREMNKILAGVDPHDEMAAFEAWEDYLNKELSFPIDASVNEASSRGPVRVGDRVRIHGIELVDDHYGIIVKIKRGRETFHHPLCDLKADPSSPYHDAIQLYAVWFANR